MWGRSAGAIPTPVSRTENVTPSSRWLSDSSTRPPRGVYLIAFMTRFMKSCRSRVASPSTVAGSRTSSDTARSAVLAQDDRGLEDFVHERVEGHRLTNHIVPPFVGPGQREQRIHEVRHPTRLLQRLLERDELLGRVRWRRQGTLDVRAQHRERRLELVARIGRESPESR